MPDQLWHHQGPMSFFFWSNDTYVPYEIKLVIIGLRNVFLIDPRQDMNWANDDLSTVDMTLVYRIKYSTEFLSKYRSMFCTKNVFFEVAVCAVKVLSHGDTSALKHFSHLFSLLLQLISDAGYQGEITSVSTACHQIEVFSRVLRTSITTFLEAGPDAIEKNLQEFTVSKGYELIWGGHLGQLKWDN